MKFKLICLMLSLLLPVQMSPYSANEAINDLQKKYNDLFAKSKSKVEALKQQASKAFDSIKDQANKKIKFFSGIAEISERSSDLVEVVKQFIETTKTEIDNLNKYLTQTLKQDVSSSLKTPLSNLRDKLKTEYAKINTQYNLAKADKEVQLKDVLNPLVTVYTDIFNAMIKIADNAKTKIQFKQVVMPVIKILQEFNGIIFMLLDFVAVVNEQINNNFLGATSNYNSLNSSVAGAKNSLKSVDAGVSSVSKSFER